MPHYRRRVSRRRQVQRPPHPRLAVHRVHQPAARRREEGGDWPVPGQHDDDQQADRIHRHQERGQGTARVQGVLTMTVL